MVLALVLILRPRVLKKDQVHSSTKKYIVFNKIIYILYIDFSELCDDIIEYIRTLRVMIL